ncbi:hypothetical protein RRG08_004673 [Elysia crispata]|uniref:Uncharacterized protein n=1 Tax=Elysia crispata TaxID=231223 RepID=A0AAE1AAU0_9GAST|nr:hypothetical protein RRG08_004673 [Elysia crispata]
MAQILSQETAANLLLAQEHKRRISSNVGSSASHVRSKVTEQRRAPNTTSTTLKEKNRCHGELPNIYKERSGSCVFVEDFHTINELMARHRPASLSQTYERRTRAGAAIQVSNKTRKVSFFDQDKELRQRTKPSSLSGLARSPSSVGANVTCSVRATAFGPHPPTLFFPITARSSASLRSATQQTNSDAGPGLGKVLPAQSVNPSANQNRAI